MPGDDPPAAGEEDEEEEHLPPVIVDFQAFFDGIDQYTVYGRVERCEDVDGLLVEFGGVFAGESATTGVDGWFYTILVHEEATGQYAHAVTTCHEGLRSPQATCELY
jgi:hypothetical protein